MENDRPTKILLIDDNKVLTGTVQIALKLAGFDVDVANGGSEGLEKMAAELPDMVILDINMPGKDGFAVMAEMRENPETSDIPVMFLSAQNDDVTVVQGLTVADDYMVKPFSPLELEVRVRKILERRGAVRNRVTIQASAYRSNHLPVHVGSETYLVPQKDIRYISAAKNYSYVHTGDRKFLAGYAIGDLENRLEQNPDFLRIHRSLIVNITHLSKFRKDSARNLVVVLDDADATELRVSDAYQASVKERLDM
ncbi:MAG TPA: response regulator [Candidatus Anoxymicrobiaceae bacterium]